MPEPVNETPQESIERLYRTLREMHLWANPDLVVSMKVIIHPGTQNILFRHRALSATSSVYGGLWEELNQLATFVVDKSLPDGVWKIVIAEGAIGGVG